MNDEPISNTPKWFSITAIVLLIWNLMGVMAFFSTILMSPEALESLPPAEAELIKSTPLWANVAFGFAVFGGTLGCLALALKKALAFEILVLSLVAIGVQMFHGFFLSQSFAVFGPGGLIMPIMVIVVAVGLVFMAKRAKTEGWIS